MSINYQFWFFWKFTKLYITKRQIKTIYIPWQLKIFSLTCSTNHFQYISTLHIIFLFTTTFLCCFCLVACLLFMIMLTHKNRYIFWGFNRFALLVVFGVLLLDLFLSFGGKFFFLLLLFVTFIVLPSDYLYSPQRKSYDVN